MGWVLDDEKAEQIRANAAEAKRQSAYPPHERTGPRPARYKRPDQLDPLSPAPCADADKNAAVLSEAVRLGSQREHCDQEYVAGKAGQNAVDSARHRLADHLSGDRPLPADELASVREVIARAPEFKAMVHARRRKQDIEHALDRLIVENYATFEGWCLEAEAEMLDAARALAEPLAAYLAARERTVERWAYCHTGTVAAVEARDARFRHLRDRKSVQHDAAVPESPLPDDVVERLSADRCRPRVYGA